MFSEFNEAGKPKTSLITRISVEFNEFAESKRLHGRLFLRMLGRPVKYLKN